MFFGKTDFRIAPVVGLSLALACGGSGFSAGEGAAGGGGSAGGAGSGAGGVAGQDAGDGSAEADGPSCDCDNDGKCEDFTSNPRHCGGCWRNCLGATCSQGRCEPELFAAGVGSEAILEVYAVDQNHDDMYVLWVGASGQIMRRKAGAQEGDNPKALVSANDVGGVAATYVGNALNLFWTAPSGVFVCELSSDGCVGATPYAAQQAAPRLLVADEQGVYWVNEESGKLLKGNGAGESPLELATILPAPTALALATKGIYWIQKDTVFWLERPDGTQPTPLGGVCAEGIGLTMGESEGIYYTGRKNGRIGKVTSVGLVGEVMDQFEPGGLVVFGDWVYWQNNFQDPGVRRLRAKDFPPPGAPASSAVPPEVYVPGRGGLAMARSKFSLFFIDQGKNLFRMMM
jgi:hypothetical protein